MNSYFLSGVCVGTATSLVALMLALWPAVYPIQPTFVILLLAMAFVQFKLGRINERLKRLHDRIA